MKALHLVCSAGQVDDLSYALWELGTVGIREESQGEDVRLVAIFENSIDHSDLSRRFKEFRPSWQEEKDTDWVVAIQDAWPPREIGERLFLAPHWNTQPTPPNRLRIVHNPGLASGTGEHPCTQLALASLEKSVAVGDRVVDVGTGSGILAVAALLLGAHCAIALDLDFQSLETARENFTLNRLWALIVNGSADCICDEAANLVVANISATVLLSIADELLRILPPGGKLILTGFSEDESAAVEQIFGTGVRTQFNEWLCLTLAC